MYEYRPVRQNYIAHLLVVCLILLSLVSFAVSAFLPRYPVIPQAIGLILLIPTIQIITRYLVTRYLYRFCPYEDGNADIEVYAYRGGTRMQLVSRVGLEEITATAELSAANRKPPAGMRRYNYAPDIRPQRALVLSVTNGDGDCEILLCPDEKLTALLKK